MSSALKWLAGVAAAVTLVAGAGASPAAEAAPVVPLADLDGRAVDPFAASKGAKAIVVLFTSVDCPFSNRYAPVVGRLRETFEARGAAFWLIYPNVSESAARIRAHLDAFGYHVRTLRDPQHALVKLAGALVTPEAALYDRQQRLVYHGRIDDRYVSLGLERPAPTRHDLEEALSATLAGRPVRAASAPAVGCFIE